jgi:PAS domain S-box-containing protein
MKMEDKDLLKQEPDENLFFSIVEQSQDAIYILFEGRFEYFNRKFSEIFQITLVEANSPDFSMFNLVAPESRNFIEERLKKIAQGEPVEPHYDFIALTMDGRKIVVEVSVSYVPYRGGTASYGILRDVTARKRIEEKLQETEHQQKAILDNIPDIAWLKDRESRYIAVNEPFGKACGVRPENIGSRTDLELWPRELAEKYREEDKDVMQSGRQKLIEEPLVGRNGKSIWVETIKSPIYDESGNVIGTAGIARDITEKKVSRERLSRINECFLSFVADPMENIQRLTALFGMIMGASCALYNRIEGGMLCTIGQWHTPPDFNPVDKPEGHICYDLIKYDLDSPFILKDLQHTSYMHTDPNVAHYGLRTYVGQKVKSGGVTVGALCAVYQEDFSPSESEIKVMGIIASALSIQEEQHRAEEELKTREKELFIKSRSLEEVNTALKVLLKRRDEDSKEFEKRVLLNVKKLIAPYIKRLKKSGLNPDQLIYADILESNISEITSPFSKDLSAKYMDLTDQEIHVAHYIREGKTSKDIARLLNITVRTVNFHRENIRKKLGLTNKKTNIRSYLLAIS